MLDQLPVTTNIHWDPIAQRWVSSRIPDSMRSLMVKRPTVSTDGTIRGEVIWFNHNYMDEVLELYGAIRVNAWPPALPVTASLGFAMPDGSFHISAGVVLK